MREGGINAWPDKMPEYLHAVSTNKLEREYLSFAFTKEPHVLKPKTTYRVSFFMRLQGVEPVGKGNAGVYAEFWDGDWRYFPRNSAPCGTRDWSYQEYVFKTGKKMPDHPYFHFLISGAKGTAWFDDVRVEELPQPQPRKTAKHQKDTF